MPRCKFIVPSTKLMCKQKALDDCTYCRVHKDKVNAANANKTVMRSINLLDLPPLPCSPDIVHDCIGLAMPPACAVEGIPQDVLLMANADANAGANTDAQMETNIEEVEPLIEVVEVIDAPRPVIRVDDAIQGTKRRIVEVTSATDIPSSHSDIEAIKVEVARIAACVEALERRINIQPIHVDTPIRVRVTKPLSEYAIARRAQALFYREFKQKCPDVIRDMTMKAVSAGLLSLGEKLPWGNIKSASNTQFGRLSDADKLMYFSMAKETIEKKLKI